MRRGAVGDGLGVRRLQLPPSVAATFRGAPQPCADRGQLPFGSGQDLPVLVNCLRSMRDKPGATLTDQAWLTASDWVDAATVLRVAALLQCGHASCDAASAGPKLFSSVKFWREGRSQAPSPDPFQQFNDGIGPAAKHCDEQERPRVTLRTTLTVVVDQHGKLTTLELSPPSTPSFKACLLGQVARLHLPAQSNLSLTLHLGPGVESHAP